METLIFNVSDIELIEEVSNSQFAKVKIKAFADGDNAHGMPILTKALKNAESSIINKPVTYIYDARNDDATGHGTGKEIPCGFVSPEFAEMSYELTDDGRLMFVVNALVWKYYSGRMFEIFKRDGVKSVSVVITLIEKEVNSETMKEEITSFCYNAITVLGDAHTPAVKDAQLELLEFSKAKEELEECLSQGFSINHDIDEEPKILEKEENNNMEFDKIEFAKVVGMTAEQMNGVMYNATKSYKVKDGDYEYSKYYMRDYSAEYVFAYDYEKDYSVALPYTMEEGKPNIDFESPKACRMAYVIEDGEFENVGFAEIIKENVEPKIDSIKKEKEDIEVKFSELETKKVEVEKELEDLKVTFSEIEKDNESLKEFKSNVEETERQNQIEYAINGVSDDLTPEQIQEWKGKVEEFANVEAFANAIQSFAYSLTKKSKKKKDIPFERIAIPTEKKEDKSGSVWSRL
jgi:hypothetical protein